MKTTDFIISQIDYLVKKYPNIKCRYEFDEQTDSHYIEVSPCEFYINDKNFQLDEAKIIEKFITNYSYESVTFITDSDLFSIEKSKYSVSGNTHNKNNTIFSDTFIDLMSENYSFINISDKFEIDTDNFILSSKTVINSISYTSFENTQIEPLIVVELKEIISENKYALAA